MVTSVCSSKECTHNTLFAIGKTLPSCAQTLLAAVETVYIPKIMCDIIHQNQKIQSHLPNHLWTIMVFLKGQQDGQHSTRTITKLQCCRVQQQQWPPVGSTTPWRKFCFSFRNPPTGVPTLDVPAHRTLRPTHLWIAGDRWWSWLFRSRTHRYTLQPFRNTRVHKTGGLSSPPMFLGTGNSIKKGLG